MRQKPICGALAAAILVLAASQFADACTRVLWNDNKLAVLAARTMDWLEFTDPILTPFPRGRDGGRAGLARVVAENPAKWTSKYASMLTTIYSIGTADGLNECGLYLTATDFGARDASKPDRQAGSWAQYALDTAATVNEAVDVLDKIQA